MNNDIVILREAIKKIVPMLAGKGLTVTQMGTQAYVQPHPQTGLPWRVNIPLLPDTAEPEFVAAIQGFIDHEVAHVLYTDFLFKAREKSKRLHNLHNIMEDTMIERFMSRDFPGSKRNIAWLRKFFLSNVTAPSIDNAQNAQEEFDYLVVVVMRALAGHVEFQAFMDDNKHWDHVLVKALMQRLPKTFIDNAPRLASTEETYEAALVLEAILYPPPPPAPPQPQPPEEEEQDDQDQGDGSDDQDPSDGEDDQDHSDEEQSGDGEGQGEREHTEDNEKASGGEGESEEEKDDDAGNGEDEGSGEGKETADDEVDGDNDDADGESTDTGDDDKTGEEDAGQGDSGAEEEDGASDADDADDQDGSGDSDDDQQSEGDEADGELADGESEAENSDAEGEDQSSSMEDGSDGEEADETDDGESDGSAGADASDAESEEDDETGEDGSGEASDVDVAVESTGAEDGDDDGSSSDEDEDATDASGIGYEEQENPFSEMEDDALEGKDLSQALVKIIVREAIQAIRASDYTVFTREYDKIETLNVPKEFDSKHVVELDEKTRSLTGVMQKDIERMMAAQSRVFNVAGQRSGRLNSAGLHRLTAGDARIFSRREEIRAKNTAVCLLSDCSGSMQGAPMATAMSASYALASVLERCNIPAECMGFTTANVYGGAGVMSRAKVKELNDAYSRERNKSGINFSRVLPIYMPIFKEYHERLNSEVKKRFAYQRSVQAHMGGNIDGESLEYAAMRLAQRKEERKVIIVLSDGFPAGAVNDAEHLKMMVGKLTKMGFDLVGIGIDSEAVSRFYDNYLILKDVDDLPKAVMGELKKILTK